MATGYGKAVYCYGANGLQPGRALTGKAAVAASIWRCMNTSKGALQGGREELGWGFDLRRLLGAPASSVTIARAPTDIEYELSKDERIAAVSAEVSYGEVGGLYTATVLVTVTLVDEGETFALTLGVNELTVDIIGGLPE